jgi:hypothetical protein
MTAPQIFRLGALAFVWLSAPLGVSAQNSTGNTSTAASVSGLHFVSGPANGTAEVTAILPRYFSNPFPSSNPPLDPKTTRVLPPLPLYLVSDDIAGNASLDSAILSGYYYPIESSGQILAAAELILNGSGKTTLMGVLDYGLFADVSNFAVTQLPTMPSVQTGSYEVRFLSNPALYLIALWLKSDSNSGDLICPIVPSGRSLPGLELKQVYPADVFLKGFRPYAQKRIAAITAAATIPTFASLLAASQRAAALGPDQTADTATSRLLALQQTLNDALGALKNFPPPLPGDSVNSTITAVNLALADTASALNDVQAHPAENPLPIDSPPTGWPIIPHPGPHYLFSRSDSSSPAVITYNLLFQGLLTFINGAPGGGNAVMPGLNGNRDLIIRDVFQTWSIFISSVAQARRGYATDTPPPSASPAGSPGSISGIVLLPDGRPAAHALISLHSKSQMRAKAIADYTPPPPGTKSLSGFQAGVAKMSPVQRQSAIESSGAMDPKGIYAPGIPATITDDHGAFTISNLPQDTYIIVANLASNPVNKIPAMMSTSRQPVVLDPGADLQLAPSLQFPQSELNYRILGD